MRRKGPPEKCLEPRQPSLGTCGRNVCCALPSLPCPGLNLTLERGGRKGDLILSCLNKTCVVSRHRGAWDLAGLRGLPGERPPPSGGRDRGPPKLDPLCLPFFTGQRVSLLFSSSRRRRKGGRSRWGKRRNASFLRGTGRVWLEEEVERVYPLHPATAVLRAIFGLKGEEGLGFDSHPPTRSDHDHG